MQHGKFFDVETTGQRVIQMIHFLPKNAKPNRSYSRLNGSGIVVIAIKAAGTDRLPKHNLKILHIMYTFVCICISSHLHNQILDSIFNSSLVLTITRAFGYRSVHLIIPKKIAEMPSQELVYTTRGQVFALEADRIPKQFFNEMCYLTEPYAGTVEHSYIQNVYFWNAKEAIHVKLIT